MQDKASAVSYGWSGLTIMMGALTWQEWAAAAGIAGVVITTAVKVWESRQKIKIERESAKVARQADSERAGYWRNERRRKNRRREFDPEPEDK